MKLIQSLAIITFGACAPLFSASAAAPSGYYSSCENKGGRELLTALHSVINDHNDVSYAGLWTLYYTSDVDADGKIWDMYSTKRWTPGTSQCGSYSKVGDCYNREHSMPKSWFNDASPMVSDAFHIYPTDGKVNGQRSNYPYGECANGSYLSANGSVKPLGRLGASTFPGYSGTVFEPDDEYKGDFARTYFYMAACYNDRISTWKSDMLAGNNYPVFTTWTVELLLKWHRQDPVSKKETDRNDVVYGQQRNRNPFIDYPELAEYIWGDMTDSKWTSTSTVVAAINKPLDKSTIDLGVAAKGHTLQKTVDVLTTGATGNVSVTVAGSGFSVSPATLTASAANAGTSVSVSWLPASAGTASGTLTVKCGSASSTVSLTGTAVDGLPAAPAQRITDESFVAVWTYIGDADAKGCYTLTVSDEAGVIPGYPKAVNAEAGEYEVTGLVPETDYTYTLASQNLVSAPISVRTAAALPSIDFFYDGTLYLVGEPGEPSECAELLVSTANVESDFTVSVSEPFEISVDRSHWDTSLTLSPDESRLYIRINASAEGLYQSSIRAVYGNFEDDSAVVRGIVASSDDFCEDFEAEGENVANYNDKPYTGTACEWYLRDAGIYGKSDPAYSGSQALRLGKSAASSVEMSEGRIRGIGDLSFYARSWGSDESATLVVEYSVDNGTSFKEAGTVTVDSYSYSRYTVHVGAPSGARARIRQTKGARVLVDDIAISDNLTGVSDAAAERHLWDAYSHGGTLFVDITGDSCLDAAVYCVDGTTLWNGRLEPGSHSFSDLAPGSVYIVLVGDFSRTVLVR